MMNPLVSIIVPSYNQGRFLEETLRSILSQSYRPMEILVLDGASKDETLDVLSRYADCSELNWWSEPDDGPADAVNKGLQKARGTIAAIQSSDDLYLPGAIASAVEALSANPDLDLVYADSTAIDADGNTFWQSRWAPYSLENFLLRTTGIPQGSAFFRLEAARGVGGWQKAYFVADTDMWLRMAFRGRFLKVDGLWSALRMHPNQRDKQNKKIFWDYWRMLRDCRPLRQATWRIKGAAVAGAASLIQRHDPYRSPLVTAFFLWIALLAHPQGSRLIRHHDQLFPYIGQYLTALLRRMRRILRRLT